MKRIILLFALTIGLGQEIASSQDNKMTLDQCMIYATQNSFTVKKAEIKLRNAKLDHTNKLLSQLPSLGAGTRASSSFGRGIDPETNTYINTATFNNSISADLSLPVFNVLSFTNATRTSRLAELSGIEEKRQAEDRVAMDCMVAYVEVVYCKSLVKLTEEKLENSHLSLRKAQRQSELGMVSAADLAQIEAELASEELSLINRQNSLEASILRLKDLMNYPIDSSLEVEDQIPLVDLINTDRKPLNIYTEALEKLPQAVIGENTLETARLAMQTARWSMLPSVNIGGGINTGYYTSLKNNKNGTNYTKQLENNLGEYVGMSLNIPLFSGLDKRTRYNKAKNNYTQAQNDWSETQRKIRSEIEQAVMDCESAEKQWIQADKNATAMDLAHRANQRKYDDGLLSIIELQISANKLLQARAELVYSRLRYATLCRQVNYYNGVPYV